MKRVALGFLLSGALLQPAFAALAEGKVAPDFSARASLAGHPFNYSLHDELKKGPVVVYFYPSAYTGGCNAQAHEFSVQHDRFAAAGASVIGVSLDNIDRLNDFSADPDYCAGKVAVASDSDGKISKSYELNIREALAGKKDTRGAEINHGFAERTTFVVGTDGKIVATVSGLKPLENVAKALELVQKIADEKSHREW